ncbi:MAG: hypothetical protein QOK12_871 [Mycobacterium sp.]|nr:hypothetical protein [Mycobacterium sp.]
MTAPAEPRILAEVGGLAVAEQGPLIVIVDRGTGPLATVAFVLGILALVPGGFGAVTLALSATNGAAVPWWVASIVLLVGIAFAGAAFAVVGRIRGAKTKPLSGFRPAAIFDRAQRVFVDADGVVVAPLDHVRFERRTQLTSSSPLLVAVTPGGAFTLKRGNPFNGGLGNLEDVLTEAVFGGAR